uniref:Uncharacterized protein n=1 Tax=Anguilla anguilla TaxID=7936 RepID=A0A0E9SY27_ANGAN
METLSGISLPPAPFFSARQPFFLEYKYAAIPPPNPSTP